VSKFFLILFLSLLLIGVVSAQADLVYVTRDVETPEPAVISALDELDITYEVIEDDNVPGTDFTQYEMILVWDEPLENYENIPITIRKSMVANTYYLGHWKIGEYAGTSISTGYLDAEIYEDSKITEGVSGVFQVYDEREVIMSWLSYKPKRAPGLKKAVITTNVQEYPIVGYINKGAMLYGGGAAEQRTSFFGITESDAWTPESEQIFKNTVEWTLYGDDGDYDGFYIDDDCDDENPLINPDADEIPYNGVDEDCDGVDLTDVDEDGYDSWEVGGEDCDDFDEMYNPGSLDIFLNCVNDAPIIEDIAKVTVTEGEEFIVEVDAWDAELDTLTYFINDTRFVQDENIFTWQTDFDDEGIYYFTISVEDGEEISEKEVEVEVEHKNQNPICDTIDSVEWNEDETGTLNIGDYCYDPDGDILTFGIYETSSSTTIGLESFEDGIAVFNSAENWHGEDWIIFIANDGKDETITNNITLIVNPVNDAPEFEGNIGDITWEEDTNLLNHLNLNHYFSDDSPLVYTVSGNYYIDLQIVSGIITFIPQGDWFGSEEVFFTADDGEFTASSNQLTLTVTDKNEEPEFLELTCETNLTEDEEYTCTLEAIDEEGDDFEFSVSGEDNLDCEIEGSELTYKSYQDYSGMGGCTLRVGDEYGFSETELQVDVAGVNDAPRITPIPDGNVKIIEGNTQLFEVEVEEVDGDDYEISWKLDGEEAGSSTGYLFNEPKGNYTLKVIVSDGIEKASYEWEVRVGDISEFTCSEVGGYSCEEGKFCYKDDILNVLGSGTCCLVKCQPELRELERCEDIEEKIEIITREPDQGEEFRIGDTINVDVKVKNELDEDIDAEVTAYFYDLTDEEVIDDDSDNVDIEEGESEELEFSFEVKNSLDDNNEYVVFVKVKDEYCNEEMISINIEREENNVVIKDLNIEQNARCGENLDYSVKLVNKGSKGQDVTVKVESAELGINKESEEFELEKYGREDTETKRFTFSIPEDAQGEYKIITNILFNGKRRVNEQIVSVTCRESEEIGEVQEKIQMLSLGTKQELVNEPRQNADNAGKALLAITIATTIIVLLVIIYILYTLFKN